MASIVWRLSLLLPFAVSIHYETIAISAALGKIIGNVHDGMYEFLGVQYGVSPTGDLRFRPSTLNTTWNSTYNATNYGPWCIQPYSDHLPNQIQSEDCLYLNIWTPQIDRTDLLPVQFWIHGGAFVDGSGADPSFNGVNYVANAQNIVLVTINYRLGPLGFLQSPQLYDEDPNWKSYGGLNGIYDQIQALKWVKQYISDFGGDPNQITIFGESAGALSVCMLVISPKVPSNIFQRAIQESGACTGPWSPDELADGIQKTESSLQQHNLSTNITELRKISAFEFQFTSFNPSVDGLVLTQLPLETYVQLNEKNVVFNAHQLIYGFNSMDGIIGFPYHGGTTPNTSAQYHAYIAHYISNQTQVALIENVYYPLTDYPAYGNRSNASIAWQTINGDVCVACPTLIQMQNVANQMKEMQMAEFAGYVYGFRGGGPPYYAPHASEIPFVFAHPSNETFFDVPWNQQLSDSMLSAWSNFGKYGVPNISAKGSDFEWNAFTVNDESVIVLDDDIRMETNYVSMFRHGACQFWYDEVGLIPTMQKICYDVNP